MAMITNDWLDAIQGEFAKPYYRDLFHFVKDEYSRAVIYPPADDIFNAFHFTPLSKVKVLILGQDPYHNVHQAHGLSFSVPVDQKEIPPSLQNIYKELHDDLGCDIPNNGYLKKWADQGVLLLNTVLTVRAHQAASHQGKGWERFTDAVIQAVNAQDRPIVYMGSSDCLYAVGQTGTEQDPDADESEASDLKGTSSESIVCISWIFRLQAFQSGK
ncbi:uracil-DNA glycosylase [Roseburia sp. CAG:380]|nr:uracil-DNA glycosylase [Roseburia sp. CAG:380]